MNLRDLGTDMVLILLRGVYGVLIGLILYFSQGFMVSHVLIPILDPTIWSYICGLVYLAILYLPTVLIARKLGANGVFNVGFRGISVYFSAAYLTWIVLSS